MDVWQSTEPVFEGPLQHREKKKLSTRCRWFAGKLLLETIEGPKRLALCDKESHLAVLSIPLNEVLSVSATKVKELNHSFKIVTTRKNHVLGAKSSDQRDMWISCISNVVNAVPLPSIVYHYEVEMLPNVHSNTLNLHGTYIFKITETHAALFSNSGLLLTQFLLDLMHITRIRFTFFNHGSNSQGFCICAIYTSSLSPIGEGTYVFRTQSGRDLSRIISARLTKRYEGLGTPMPPNLLDTPMPHNLHDEKLHTCSTKGICTIPLPKRRRSSSESEMAKYNTGTKPLLVTSLMISPPVDSDNSDVISDGSSLDAIEIHDSSSELSPRDIMVSPGSTYRATSPLLNDLLPQYAVNSVVMETDHMSRTAMSLGKHAVLDSKKISRSSFHKSSDSINDTGSRDEPVYLQVLPYQRDHHPTPDHAHHHPTPDHAHHHTTPDHAHHHTTPDHAHHHPTPDHAHHHPTPDHAHHSQKSDHTLAFQDCNTHTQHNSDDEIGQCNSNINEKCDLRSKKGTPVSHSVVMETDHMSRTAMSLAALDSKKISTCRSSFHEHKSSDSIYNDTGSQQDIDEHEYLQVLPYQRDPSSDHTHYHPSPDHAHDQHDVSGTHNWSHTSFSHTPLNHACSIDTALSTLTDHTPLNHTLPVESLRTCSADDITDITYEECREIEHPKGHELYIDLHTTPDTLLGDLTSTPIYATVEDALNSAIDHSDGMIPEASHEALPVGVATGTCIEATPEKNDRTVSISKRPPAPLPLPTAPLPLPPAPLPLPPAPLPLRPAPLSLPTISLHPVHLSSCPHIPPRPSVMMSHSLSDLQLPSEISDSSGEEEGDYVYASREALGDMLLKRKLLSNSSECTYVGLKVTQQVVKSSSLSSLNPSRLPYT